MDERGNMKVSNLEAVTKIVSGLLLGGYTVTATPIQEDNNPRVDYDIKYTKSATSLSN